jgi:hypothetical protein
MLPDAFGRRALNHTHICNGILAPTLHGRKLRDSGCRRLPCCDPDKIGSESLCFDTTSESPAVSTGALKRPSALAVKVLAIPVALFVTVTAALGTTAPLASVTVPVMIPVAVCGESVTPDAFRRVLLQIFLKLY